MSFSPVPINTTTAPLDPSKHVNYSLGMILGVDDLNQDFAYHADRHKWIVRDLIGYGTACGLQVTQDASDVNKGPSITVSPGVAVNPQGQFIRVTPAQCAYINAWLNGDAISPLVASHLDGSGQTTIYLKLCYRDCLTDSVPLPGEPCRTEASGDLLVPSRVQDDFSLDFSFDGVEQAEEDGLRLFVAWLRQVKVATTGSKIDKLVTALRAAAEEKFAKPPASGLAISTDMVTEALRALFLVWTTEIRPGLRGQGADCVTPSSQDCVMLAAIHFKVSGAQETGWAVNGKVVIDETDRPYLLHLRLLQEWLLTHSGIPLVPDDSLLVTETTYNQASAPGVSDHYASADHTHGTPPAVVVPTPDDKALVSETTFGQTIAPGISDHFARADHTHGTPVAPSANTPDDKALVGETTFGQAKAPGVSDHYARADHTHGSPANPIPAHKADPSAHTLSGDVAGAINGTLIQSLHKQPVKAETPVDGQYLKYVKDHWEPADVPQGPTQQNFVLRPAIAKAYAISAAGILGVDSEKPFIDVRAAYYGLRVDMTTFARGRFGIQFIFSFNDYDPAKNYIVKLTPVVDPEFPPFVAGVIKSSDTGILINLSSLPAFDGPIFGGLMIEVSQFS